jgi:hypothetical protein
MSGGGGVLRGEPGGSPRHSRRGHVGETIRFPCGTEPQARDAHGPSLGTTPDSQQPCGFAVLPAAPGLTQATRGRRSTPHTADSGVYISVSKPATARVDRPGSSRRRRWSTTRRSRSASTGHSRSSSTRTTARTSSASRRSGPSVTGCPASSTPATATCRLAQARRCARMPSRCVAAPNPIATPILPTATEKATGRGAVLV